MTMRIPCLLAATAGLALLLAGTAKADPVADFYHGKTLTLLVGSESGGISDIDGRLVTRHLGKHLPGSPSFVVQNMPGAGGLTLANHIYNVVPKDGATIGTFGRGVAQLAVLGDSNARFDPVKFTWLASTSSYSNDAYLFVVNAGHPARTVEDLKGSSGPNVKIGTLSIGATNQIFADLAKEVLHLNVAVIRGYSGGPSIFLAMQKNEVDGQMVGLSTLTSAQKSLWDSGGVRPLVQFGRLTRLPEMPSIPTGRELATTDDDRAVLEFAELPFFMAQPYTAPPGIPADRAAALRAGLAATYRDPAFLEEAKKLGLDVSPIGGEEITQLLRRSQATPKPVLDRYIALNNVKK